MTTPTQDPPITIHRETFLFHHNPAENTFDQIYKLGKQIARGGFAKIHICTHRRTDQKRAVKILPKSKVVSEDAFKKEVSILRRVDHPNVLRLYESFEDSDNYYIITELATGGDMFEYLSSNYQNLTERDIASLMKQILACIHHCHVHGVVHCDLKPENILLDNDRDFERLTLCDFGFALFYSKDERLKLCRGTPEFMAPEVVFHRSYGPKCDIFSCGVLTYLLLVGELPFSGGNLKEICIQLRDREDHFLVDGWSHISAQGKDFVQALLRKDASTRPTAEEALRHPWLDTTTYSTNEQPSGDGASLHTNETQGRMSLATWNRNLIQFSAQQKLKQATYAFIVAQLTYKTLKKRIDEVFRAVDLNGDGRICHAELEASLLHHGKVFHDKGEIRDIFRRCDIDENGYINYWEFVAATMNASTMLSADNLKIAFEVFDKSKSESITSEDLKSLLWDMSSAEDDDDEINEAVIKAIIEQVDTNGDGEISYEEFVAMMQENNLPPKRRHESIG